MTEGMNPYTVLGVDRDATPEEISKAFKSIAKKHHPDVVGGENQTFNDARKALDVLSNQNSRKLYDDFGVIPGDEGSASRVKAIEELSQLFVSILSQVTPDNVMKVDFLGTMRERVTNRLHEIEGRLQAIPAEEARLASYQKVLNARLKRSPGGKDIFADVLARMIAHAAVVRQSVEAEANVAEAMLLELDSYTFEVEQVRSAAVGEWVVVRNWSW